MQMSRVQLTFIDDFNGHLQFSKIGGGVESINQLIFIEF